MRHFLLQTFVCCLTFSCLYLCCFSLCSALSNNEVDPYQLVNHSRLKVGDVYQSSMNEPLLVKRQEVDQQTYLSRFANWVCTCLSGRSNSDNESINSYTSQIDVHINTSETDEEVTFLPQMPTYKTLTQADIAKHMAIAKDLNHPDMWEHLMCLYNSRDLTSRGEVYKTVEDLAFTSTHQYAFRAARLMMESNIPDCMQLGNLAMLDIATYSDERHQIQAILYVWNQTPSNWGYNSDLIQRMQLIADNPQHSFAIGAAARLYYIYDTDIKEFAFVRLLDWVPQWPIHMVDLDWVNGAEIVEGQLLEVQSDADELYNLSIELPQEVTVILEAILKNVEHEVFLDAIAYILKKPIHGRMALFFKMLTTQSNKMSISQKNEVKKLIHQYVNDDDQKALAFSLLN